MTCCICGHQLGENRTPSPDGELCSGFAQYASIYVVALDGLEAVAKAAMEEWATYPRVTDPAKNFPAVMVLVGHAARSPALRKRVMG